MGSVQRSGPLDRPCSQGGDHSSLAFIFEQESGMRHPALHGHLEGAMRTRGGSRGEEVEGIPLSGPSAYGQVML